VNDKRRAKMKNHGISDSKMYAMMTAMRGPDSQLGDRDILYILKQTITIRMRSIIFYGSECQGNYRDDPMMKNDVVEVVRVLRVLLKKEEVRYESGERHYIMHLAMALRVVYDHEVWGGYGNDLLNMCEMYPNTIAVTSVINEFEEKIKAREVKEQRKKESEGER
jgi:hypothetical protein